MLQSFYTWKLFDCSFLFSFKSFQLQRAFITPKLFVFPDGNDENKKKRENNNKNIVYVQNEEIPGIFFLSDKKLAVGFCFTAFSTFFLSTNLTFHFSSNTQVSRNKQPQRKMCFFFFQFFSLIKNISIVKW